MIDTNINNIKLGSCIINASGCWCTTGEELDNLMESCSGAVVSKSSTIEYREGNEKPRYNETELGTINSMGVPNFGYQFYMNYNLKKEKEKPFIQSIIPFCKGDMILMLKKINNLKINNNIVEINLSCPNIIKKKVVGLDMESLEDYLVCLDNLNLENLTVGIKLPPYYEQYQFDEVSNLILKYKKNIKFITCINSIINGLLIDIEEEKTLIYPKGGLGGIGGQYCLPTALSNVKNFYDRLGDKVQIIGCGGIKSGKEVFSHILAGASIVSVGSQLIKEGPKVFDRLNNELIEIMNKKNYKSINEFRGKLLNNT